MGFRENLKAELEYQGILVKELAEKSGVSKKTIDHYLTSDPREPLVSNAVAIAKVLNVSVEYLVDGKTSIKEPSNNEIKQLALRLSKLSKKDLNIILGLIKILEENH
jgi:transcriptional regulator with XRE-family HTH domain